MWVLRDVLGPFPTNVGSFSRNVGRSAPIFSANLGPQRRMFSGPAVYVLGSLQIALAAQDKYTVKVPGGLAFSEFRGYEAWQAIAISHGATAVAVIPR